MFLHLTPTLLYRLKWSILLLRFDAIGRWVVNKLRRFNIFPFILPKMLDFFSLTICLDDRQYFFCVLTCYHNYSVLKLLIFSSSFSSFSFTRFLNSTFSLIIILLLQYSSLRVSIRYNEPFGIIHLALGKGKGFISL